MGTVFNIYEETRGNMTNRNNRGIMGNAKASAIVVALGLGLIFASPFAAQAKKSGEKESQKGGLPALEDRVEVDEGLIATLQTEVATLQSEVATLQTQVATLLGQSQFAVVASDGTLVRSSTGVAIDTHTASSGAYELTFSKDVSGCAYVATLGDTASGAPVAGEVSVSGDHDADSNPNDVFVQTSDSTGAAADASFHLYVNCP
jgi:hypothetical protein